MCILGGENVGKTSLCKRLEGTAFSRKAGCKASLEDVATRYSIEVETTSGLMLFHLFDWAWSQKLRVQSINQQLMRGNDGSVFMYDITDRRSKSDYGDYNDWFGRAAGFDKPCLIVSNKNDQKKRAVQNHEGQALATKGDRRAYVALNLVDDEGCDDIVLQLVRVMTADANINVLSYRKASEATLHWSDEQAATAMAGIGLGSGNIKTHRVLVVLSSSSSGAWEKFSESLFSSNFLLEMADCGETCEELWDAQVKSLAAAAEADAEAARVQASAESSEGGETGASESTDRPKPVPIIAIICPPSAPERQHRELVALGSSRGIPILTAPPRTVLAALEELLPK